MALPFLVGGAVAAGAVLLLASSESSVNKEVMMKKRENDTLKDAKIILEVAASIQSEVQKLTDKVQIGEPVGEVEYETAKEEIDDLRMNIVYCKEFLEDWKLTGEAETDTVREIKNAVTVATILANKMENAVLRIEQQTKIA